MDARRPIKIAYICGAWPYKWAPTEWLWHLSAQLGLRDGHSVLVSTYQAKTPSQLIALGESGALIHKRPFINHLPLQRRLDYYVYPFRRLHAFNPDVIVFIQAGIDDFTLNFSIKALRRVTRQWNIPHVVICNYNDDHYVPSDQMRSLSAEFFEASAGVITFSESNLLAYRRQLASRLPTGKTLKNPLNLTLTTPVDWPKQSEPVCIGYVGRLAAQHKGLDLLLEALGSDALKSFAWQLNLYGDGPDKHYLTSLAELYGISGKVKFRGFTTDIRSAWHQNHLCISPSRAEAMPIALWEGMVCGRPAIATDCGAAREWVIDGKTGYLALGASVSAIKDAMLRAFANRENWEAMGVAAHLHTARLIDHSPGKTLLEFLENVVINSKKHRPS